jgi:UDP-glucose 4-epimerase
MSKALVTGGAGFIGSNIVKLLVDEGYDVLVIDNLSSGYLKNLDQDKSVSFTEADVRDEAAVKRAMEGAEVVFHLAASVGNVRSIEQPIDDSDVNLLGTIRVLEAARRAGVRKLICKLAKEKMCLVYSKLYELDAVCLRYFNVYGVNQRYDAYGNVIPIFAHRLLRREPLIVYGDGEQTRDFVNVADVARANLLAARSSGVSGAFNVGSGVSISVNRLVAMMLDASETSVPVQHVEPRKGEVRDSRADISAARAALAFEPTVHIEQGLAEYMAWAKSELA